MMKLIMVAGIMCNCQETRTVFNQNSDCKFEENAFIVGDSLCVDELVCFFFLLKDEAIGLFAFSNPGTSPLVIEQVETSCGCTVPEWPQKPILPGKHGEIKVRYDTSQPSMFSKTIIVYFNGKNSPAKLTINGSVSSIWEVHEQE